MATNYDEIIAMIGGGSSGGGGGEAPPVLGGRVNTRATEFRDRDTPNFNKPGGLSPHGVLGGGYTADDVSELMRGLSPQKIAEIQRQMVALGLLPKNFNGFGFADKTTRSGFEEILTVANDRDMGYEETLTSLSEMQKNSSSGSVMDDAIKDIELRRQKALLGFGTNLNEYQSSDPARVRATAEAAFKEALGRKPTDKESAKFLSRFQADERAEQGKVFNAREGLEAGARSRVMAGFDLEQGAIAPGGDIGDGPEADTLWERVQQFVADSPYKIGLGKRTRSYEEQVAAKEREKRGGPKAATPGKSKHGNGRANDLQYSSPAARKWALENAGRYGLQFPIYDPSKPRHLDESWHVEVAGGGSGGGSGGARPAPPVASQGAPPISQSINTTQVDMGARAVEFARAQNPTETAAYDIGQTFNNFTEILKRGVI